MILVPVSVQPHGEAWSLAAAEVVITSDIADPLCRCKLWVVPHQSVVSRHIELTPSSQAGVHSSQVSAHPGQHPAAHAGCQHLGGCHRGLPRRDRRTIPGALPYGHEHRAQCSRRGGKYLLRTYAGIGILHTSSHCHLLHMLNCQNMVEAGHCGDLHKWCQLLQNPAYVAADPHHGCRQPASWWRSAALTGSTQRPTLRGPTRQQLWTQTRCCFGTLNRAALLCY